jgi:hypothetical protein
MIFHYFYAFLHGGNAGVVTAAVNTSAFYFNLQAVPLFTLFSFKVTLFMLCRIILITTSHFASLTERSSVCACLLHLPATQRIEKQVIRRNFGDLGVYGSLILRWTLKNMVCIGFNWLKLGSSGEHGVEHSASVKRGKFFDQLSNWLFLGVN